MVTDGSKSPQVLVIDDEQGVVETVRAALEDGGFRALTALGATEGLALYERHWREIDLVLLDYLMPEMNGDLVFETMRAIDPEVRVLLLTACDDRVAHKMFAAGLRGFIQKPFSMDDLIRQVGEEIDKP